MIALLVCNVLLAVALGVLLGAAWYVFAIGLLILVVVLLMVWIASLGL